ncbi:hypothetical protein Bhyg_06585, partial [Pseudolycoriella hygida]
TPDLSADKRGSILTRSSSFQKFKCSATYQFYLAGSKLSKESLKQLFEKVITHFRTKMQVAFVVLALPVCKLFTIAMLWSLDIFTKVFALDLIIENPNYAKLQTSEVGIFVRILHTDSNTKQTVEASKANDDNSIESRLKPEVPETQQTVSELRGSKEKKQNGYLSICVYSCVAFAYMQLMPIRSNEL